VQIGTPMEPKASLRESRAIRGSESPANTVNVHAAGWRAVTVSSK
jgi:hypothetical protein